MIRREWTFADYVELSEHENRQENDTNQLFNALSYLEKLSSVTTNAGRNHPPSASQIKNQWYGAENSKNDQNFAGCPCYDRSCCGDGNCSIVLKT